MLPMRYFSLNRAVKFFYKNFSSNAKNSPVVKVISDKDDSEVFFRYFDKPVKVTIRTHGKLEETLTLIKEKTLRKLDKLSIEKEYGKIQFDIPKEINVALMQNDSIVDSNIPNVEAWARASEMSIGDIVYKVSYNFPIVTNLTLPDYILSGCALRPRFAFECASLHDSIFIWYRSIEGNSISSLISDDILFENERYWKKIHEGYIYVACAEDLGCYLKVICTPKKDGQTGLESSVESKTVVESAPSEFSFKERQEHTKFFCEDNSIRCLDYNVLAQMYVDQDKYPYPTEKAKNADFRSQMLHKELLGYKSDIICLQEVETRLFNYLQPNLNNERYSGNYTKKGGMHEGVATFFRTDKFRCKRDYKLLLNRIVLKNEKHIYEELCNKVAGNKLLIKGLIKQNTVLQLMLLEHIHLPGHELLVANTHLYSNKDSCEVRLIQAAACIAFIEHIIISENLQSPGILFCGDFNSLPHSPTYDFLMSGKYECSGNWHIGSDTHGNTILHHSLALDSACGTPEYTNYTLEFKGCLDYIFYSKDILKRTDVVPMPRHENIIAQKALPSEYFPSDHIPLICSFQWKKS